ncbi:hypothetical protein ACWDE9_28895, partial [Streptomyces olivaceoviridis]
VDVQRRGRRVNAVVIDGAGHHPDVVRYATVVPPVITHTGIALGGLAALITAGQMAAAYDAPPHACAVYASMKPGRPTRVHWIGDCRAYGWDGQHLLLWSTDMTMGQWLRVNGGVPTGCGGLSPSSACRHRWPSREWSGRTRPRWPRRGLSPGPGAGRSSWRVLAPAGRTWRRWSPPAWSPRAWTCG